MNPAFSAPAVASIMDSASVKQIFGSLAWLKKWRGERTGYAQGVQTGFGNDLSLSARPLLRGIAWPAQPWLASGLGVGARMGVPAPHVRRFEPARSSTALSTARNGAERGRPRPSLALGIPRRAIPRPKAEGLGLTSGAANGSTTSAPTHVRRSAGVAPWPNIRRAATDWLTGLETETSTQVSFCLIFAPKRLQSS